MSLEYTEIFSHHEYDHIKVDMDMKVDDGMVLIGLTHDGKHMTIDLGTLTEIVNKAEKFQHANEIMENKP